MDRQIVYIGQIPQDTDLLLSNKDAYIGLAKLAAAILGTSTLLNAFTCVPTAPASMSVNVTKGEIYSLQNIDNSAYGSLASDTTDSIVKQGVILNSTTLALTAPGTSGNSWNILIEIGFSETDGGSTVLPYYNASNPSVPWSGPNNSGQPNNTIRFNGVTIQAKTGVQAPTGTQVTPSPDTGFVGAFVVTVANGQSTITSGNITTYSGAPFIAETLTQKISQATADLRYAQITALQNGQYVYAVDTSGVTNTVTTSLSPAITSYTAGLSVRVKIANTNTGASTININGVGAANIKLLNGNAIGAGDLIAGGIAELSYDGTNFQLKNPGTADFSAISIQNNSFISANDTGAANAYVVALTPAISSYVLGLGLSVKIANTNTSGTCTINVNGLGTKSIKLGNGANINIGDLQAGQIARLSYDGTNFQLLNPCAVVKTIVRQVFPSSGTYTPSPGMLYCDVKIVGGGGGGGGTASTGAGQSAVAGSGAAGGGSQKRFTAAQIGASQSITIGSGGNGGSAGSNAGGNGGTSTFGALLTATGGNGSNAGITDSAVRIFGSATGGTGSGGDINITGNPSGFSASSGSSNQSTSGHGGSTAWYGGGAQPQAGFGTGINATANSGGGGSGASSVGSSIAFAGGNGAAGFCEVIEYCSQ